MKIFVDNDVILDILLEREDFTFSARVIQLIENKEIIGYTSPIIFTNTFYLMSEAVNKAKAWEALRKLRLIFKITRLNQSMVDKALASGFKDFEDAIQYYSALEGKIKYLITRNKSDYVGAELIIISSQEAVALIENN